MASIAMIMNRLFATSREIVVEAAIGSQFIDAGQGKGLGEQRGSVAANTTLTIDILFFLTIKY